MSSPTDPAGKALRTARLAQLMSWLAGLIGIGFVIAFLAQAGLFQAMLPKEAAPPPPVLPDEITAGSSTVTGVDDQRQPYEVKAKRGWQDDVTPSLVHLVEPEGVFHRAGGTEYTITGETGRYDTTAKTLDLDGHVVLQQKDRFTAKMGQANIAVKEKKLVSKGPVVASFGTGTVNANGLQITDDGSRILFLNGVKARFDAPQGKGDINP